MSPRIPSEQLSHIGSTHDPHLTTTPLVSVDNRSTRSMTPPNFVDNRSTRSMTPPGRPRPHVQIPPTIFSAPDSASPRLATSPATGSRRDIPPAEMYSLRSTPPNPNARPSGSANQSPPRQYPLPFIMSPICNGSLRQLITSGSVEYLHPHYLSHPDSGLLLPEYLSLQRTIPMEVPGRERGSPPHALVHPLIRFPFCVTPTQSCSHFTSGCHYTEAPRFSKPLT
jgi:hypothetical protein